MRWKCVLSATLTVTCSLWAQTNIVRSPGAKHQNPSNQKLAIAEKNWDVVIRIYPHTDTDPEKHTQVSVKVSEGHSITFNDIQSAYPPFSCTCVILICAKDQTDSDVATQLGRYVRAYRFMRKDARVPLSFANNHDDYAQRWTFLDARGEPIPNASISVYAWPLYGGKERKDILFARTTSNRSGQIERRLPIETRFAFRIEHPDYGIAMVEYSGEEDPSGVFIVPLVPVTSPDMSHSIEGTVIDNNGRPVAGADVFAGGIKPPDNARYSHPKGIRSRAITDDQGWFSLSLPMVENDVLTGFAPEGTQCAIQIMPPKSLNLRQYGQRTKPYVQVGTHREYVLLPIEGEATSHTFAFEYCEGPMTQREELENTELMLMRDDRQWVRLGYDQFKDGYALPPGILIATTTRNGHYFRFRELTLTPHSPEHVVIRAESPVLYRGQVIDHASGQPMADTLVLADYRYSGTSLSPSTDPLWAELRKRAAWEQANDSAELPYALDGRATVTDSQGYYEFVFYPGFMQTLRKIVAMTPGRECASVHMQGRLPNAGGVVNVPTLKLGQPKSDYFPTFVFEDENGPIIDLDAIEQIHLKIEWREGRFSTCRFGDYLKNAKFVPAIYSAEVIWNKHHYTFGPIDLTTQRPKEVIFTPQTIEVAEKLYQGQVIHAVTGEPIPNAIVILETATVTTDFSSVTAEQWQWIKSLGPKPDPTDPALGPLRSRIPSYARNSFKHTLTDREGWFSLAISISPRTASRDLLIVDEHFLGVRYRVTGLGAGVGLGKPDENGIVTLQPLKLIPAGTIEIRPVIPYMGTRTPDPRLTWSFDTNTAPTWAQDYDWANTRTFYQNKLRDSVSQTLYIPADLELSLFLYEMTSGTPPTRLADNVWLKQGNLLKLGRVGPQKGIEVVVTLLDTEDYPIQGVRVYAFADGLGSWTAGKQLTDADGSITITMPFNSTGTIFVQAYDHQLGHQMREEMPYTVGSEEASERELVFRLSDRIIELLTQNGG